MLEVDIREAVHVEGQSAGTASFGGSARAVGRRQQQRRTVNTCGQADDDDGDGNMIEEDVENKAGQAGMRYSSLRETRRDEEVEYSHSGRDGEVCHSHPGRDGEVEYSHPDIVITREPTHQSYHDSDSDFVEFDLDNVLSIRGFDLDKSDADSWDWTFHDENISDLDIKMATLPINTCTTLRNISEASSNETQTTDGPNPTSHEDQERIGSTLNIDNKVRQDADQNQHVAVFKTSRLKKETSESCGGLQARRWYGPSVTYLPPPHAGHGVNDDHRPTNKDGTFPDVVVYFEDSNSSHIFKTRLKYLSDNCRVGTQINSSRLNEASKLCQTNTRKINGGLHSRAVQVVKQLDKRNFHWKSTKLEHAEAKFIFCREIRNNLVPNVDHPVRRKALPTSVCKSTLFLPPIMNKQMQSFSRHRHSVNELAHSVNELAHSVNELVPEKLISWKLHRSRGMSRSNMLVRSTSTEDVGKQLVSLEKPRCPGNWTGLERFRHVTKMVLLLLRAVGLKPKKPDETNYNFLSWTVIYDEVLGISRSNYDSGALSFDPLLYKANKESSLSQETKEILRLPSDERTEAHIQSVIVCFNNVIPTFSEFPKAIQQSMIKVCMYDKFEAGRVIIRQGHRAENFYFIISGCAVVTQMDGDAGHVHTTNVLGKGNSFGELAFLHMSKRSATVTCRENVELICIERDDFIEIFMRSHKGNEPAHITFLRSIDLIQGWPVKSLPHANPKICAFTYVRRDVILCQDGATSEWIFIVYSGSCKVLTALSEGPIAARSPETRKVSPAPKVSSSTKVSATSATSSRENAHKHGGAGGDPRTSLGESVRDKGQGDISQIEHLENINAAFFRKHVLPTVEADIEKNRGSPLPRASFQTPELPPTTALCRTKRQSYGFQPPALPSLTAPSPDTSSKQQQPSMKTTFFEIARLEAGDIFGLEHVVLSGMRDVASCSLVSEGAEVVLINKEFFKRHLSEDTLKRIRQTIRPLPSEKSMKKKYETKKLWDVYKTETMARQTQGCRRIGAKLQTS